MQMFAEAERTYVRDLAGQVAVIAHSDRMQAIRRRWCDVNERRTPVRAPVWCRPVGCWGELLPEETLTCRDPLLRGIERTLRQALVKEAIGDDSIVNPWFDVPRVFDVEPETVWGVTVGRHAATAAGGAWGYEPPIKTADDLRRLRQPRFTHNARKTEECLAATAEALGGALPVRPRCGGLLSATLGTAVADLLGMGEMMLLMAAEPGMVHQVTRHVADAVAAANRMLAEEGLLDRNNDAPMTCSDDFGPASRRRAVAGQPVVCREQPRSTIRSRRDVARILLDYQLPLLAPFGRVAYRLLRKPDAQARRRAGDPQSADHRLQRVDQPRRRSGEGRAGAGDHVAAEGFGRGHAPHPRRHPARPRRGDAAAAGPPPPDRPARATDAGRPSRPAQGVDPPGDRRRRTEPIGGALGQRDAVVGGRRRSTRRTGCAREGRKMDERNSEQGERETLQRRLLESRAYVTAFEDTELMQRDELRPIRLALELSSRDWRSRAARALDIVVFGSARTLPPTSPPRAGGAARRAAGGPTTRSTNRAWRGQ